MNEQRRERFWTAIVISGLLILTAWGSAMAMFIASMLAVAAAIWGFRRDLFQRHGIVAVIVTVVAIGCIVVTKNW